jgi:hypothetical protein
MQPDTLPTHVAAALESDEAIATHARAEEAHLAVSDRRLIVASTDRITLAVPFERLRRIEFDIERDRPATLVLVPEYPQDPPQVLSVPPDEYGSVAQALVAIGVRLYSSEAASG